MAHEWLQRLPAADQSLARAVVARGWLAPESLAALVQNGGGRGLLQLLGLCLTPEQLALLTSGAATASGRLPPPGAEARTLVHPGPGAGPSAAVIAPTVVDTARSSSASGEGPAPGVRPGGRVGPYLVEKELARGGMGVVLVARHLTLGRRVALKVLQGQARPEVQERLRIEAAAAARLKHPNIVSVHEVGEQDGAPWLAMDLIDGEDLSARVGREGPLPPDEAARLMETISRAVGYAHQQAILHRDLKPQNILVDEAGVPFLVDFGLAKDVAREGQGITVTGTFLGTPAYMPPEQAGGDLEAVDRRSDVYSLGATLYHLLVGRPPFEGATAVNVVTKVLGQEPVRPRTLRPELDADLETMCLRCLEKDPAARYPTAGALADDLARYRAGEPILARPVGPLARLARRVRRNRAASAGLAVVAVALLVVPTASAWQLNLARREAEGGRAAAVAAEESAVAAQRESDAARRRAEAQALLERAYASLAARRYTEAAAIFGDVASSAAELARDGSEADRRLVRAAGRGLAEARRRTTPAATLRTSGQGYTHVATAAGRLAVSGEDGVRVWFADDLAAPPTHLPVERGGDCLEVAVSPDGALAAAVWGLGGTYPPKAGFVVVWDVAARTERWRRALEPLNLGLLGFTNDGKLVVAKGDLAAVLVLDAGTGALVREVVRTEPGAPRDPTPYAFMALPGSAFVIGWGDGLLLREPPDGGALNLQRSPAALAPYPAPTGWACVQGDWQGGVDVLFSDRRRYPLSVGEGGRILGLDTVVREDGKEGWIAAATIDGAVALYDLGGVRTSTLRLEPTTVGDCVFLDLERVVVGRRGHAEVYPTRERVHLPGEGPVAFGRRTGRLALARPRTDQEPDPWRRFGRQVSFHEVGGLVPREVGRPVVLPVMTQEPGVSPVDVHAMAFAADDEEVVLLVGDRLMYRSVLERRRVATGALVARSKALDLSSGVLDVDGEELLLAAFGQKATVEVRPLAALDEPSRAVPGWHYARMRGAAWLPGGAFATASEDGALARWTPTSGQAPAAAIVPADGERGAVRPLTPVGAANPERHALLCLAASSDRTRLAAGCVDGVVRVLSASGEWAQSTLLGHEAKVVGCAFLPDGRLASVSVDGVLIVWDVEAGRILRLVRSPSNEVGASGLTASPDGKWVAASSSAAKQSWLVDVSVRE